MYDFNCEKDRDAFCERLRTTRKTATPPASIVSIRRAKLKTGNPEKTGLTQDEVASLLSECYDDDETDKFHRARQAYSLWENGNAIPDLPTISRLAKVFHCDPGFLLGEYDESTLSIHVFSILTGLSEASIKKLRSPGISDFLDFLLQYHSATFKRFLNSLFTYRIDCKQPGAFSGIQDKTFKDVFWRSPQQTQRLCSAQEATQLFYALLAEIESSGRKESNKNGQPNGTPR